MTSQTISGSAQQGLTDSSVRDVVEYRPEQVNDAWCRNVLHKVLQSIELQYAQQMPHRAITPDTIVFQANGEPLLILDDIDAAPAPASRLAGDLTALARVIHYAITQELAPAGPLGGRVDGYSAALVATVDACMDPDPARRPQSVDAVRSLLDSDAPAPLAAAVIVPDVLTPPAPVEVQQPGRRSGRRRAIAAGGAAVALALVLFVQLRDTGPADPIVVTAPGSAAPAQPVASAAPTGQVAVGAAADPAATAAPVTAGTPAGSLPASPASTPVDSPASGASSGGTTMDGGAVERPDGVDRAAPKPARSGDTVAAPALPGAVSGNATYQLQIKPWGTVYVDGVERGVSPPVKRLVLTPGHHTVRITNPKYRDSILEFESAPTTSNGKIIVDFDQDAQ